MINIIALCGESASGKDSILKGCLKKNPQLHSIVSCTTRPKRDYEVDGVDYYFLTNEEFYYKIEDGDMLEATIFNEWCYGTALTSLSAEKVNIGVFNLAGIEALKNNPIINLVVFYIEARDKTRLIRSLSREKDPDINEIFRRYKTDQEDFLDVEKFYDAKLVNETTEDFNKCVEVISGQKFEKVL